MRMSQPTIKQFLKPRIRKMNDKNILNTDNISTDKNVLNTDNILNTDNVLNEKNILYDTNLNLNPDTIDQRSAVEPLYSSLTDVFEKIESTTKRLQILSHLTDLFFHIILNSPFRLLECVYLCLNRVCPEYLGLELGMGESLLIKAVASATGRPVKVIKQNVLEKGDLGSVAQLSKSAQKQMFLPKPLTIHSVFQTLFSICSMSGNASQQRKIDAVHKLLISCTGNEPKYLVRSLEGKLRIGLAQQTILMALAHAIALRDIRTST